MQNVILAPHLALIRAAISLGPPKSCLLEWITPRLRSSSYGVGRAEMEGDGPRATQFVSEVHELRHDFVEDLLAPERCSRIERAHPGPSGANRRA